MLGGAIVETLVPTPLGTVATRGFEPLTSALTSAVQKRIHTVMLFADAQKLLQISIFSLKAFRERSLLFAWVAA